MNTQGTCRQDTFQFTIEKIKKHKGATLFSSPHFIQNLPWKIVVMPFYHGRTCLGLFLECDGVPENFLWTCNAKAKLKLLSVRGKWMSAIRCLQHEFCNINNRNGFSEFISWNEMLNPKNGYAPNYVITLEAHVEADAPSIEYIPFNLKRETVNDSLASPLCPSKLRKVVTNESTDTTNKWSQSVQKKVNCTSLEETAGGTRIKTMEISDNYCNREGNERAQGTFQFTVQNIKNLEGTRLHSPPYYIKRLPWKIVVAPFCMSFYVSNFQRCLGVFLQCDGTPENPLWMCKAKVDLKLISHGGTRISVTRSLEHLFCSQDYRSGFPSFVSWSDLLKPANAYMLHDTITLEAHVVVVNAPDIDDGGALAIQNSPCDLERSPKNYSASSLHTNELKKSTVGVQKEFYTVDCKKEEDEVDKEDEFYTVDCKKEEDEVDKDEKTIMLIKMADKYFSALKNLFTAKMLSNKLDTPEVLQKEVCEAENKIQEFVQYDKELQQQWQLWHQK